MPLNLRPYQHKMVEKIFEGFKEKESLMCQMPTGTGKTEVFCAVIKRFLTEIPNKKILILVHREELLRQIKNRLRERVGIIAGSIDSNGFDGYEKNVIVGMVQSVMKRGLKFSASLLVIDEAHHTNADSYLKIINPFLSTEQTKLLGVTATPGRLDKKKLSDVFELLLLSPSIKWFIERKYLAKIKYYGTRQMDLGKLRISKKDGDFEIADASTMMRSEKVIAEIVSSYFNYAEGKKTLIFCVDIAHAIVVKEKFEENGIDVEFIHGDTPKIERQKIVNKFTEGKLLVLINVLIFTEGFDCPDIEVVIIARPTQSITLYLQMIGRVTRYIDGKEFGIVLDNAGNYRIHGLPTNRFDWQIMFSNPEGLTNEDYTKRVRVGAQLKARNPPIESESIEMYELIDDSSSDSYDFEETDYDSFVDLPLRNELPKNEEDIFRAFNRESYFLKNYVCTKCNCAVHRFDESKNVYVLFDQMLPEIKVHSCTEKDSKLDLSYSHGNAFPVEVIAKVKTTDSYFHYYFSRIDGHGPRLKKLIMDYDMKTFLDSRNPVIVKRTGINNIIVSCFNMGNKNIETITLTEDKKELDKFFILEDRSDKKINELEIVDVDNEYDEEENKVKLKSQEKPEMQSTKDSHSISSEKKKRSDEIEKFDQGLVVKIKGINVLIMNRQIWMVDNLNMKTFRNGDLITVAKTVSEWVKLNRAGEAGCCYYENNEEYGAKYGMLYNWYAVNDPRGLAPEGWHIPSCHEWESLYGYLGDGILSNQRLKSMEDWTSISIVDVLLGSTILSGFDGLPAGYRHPSGEFRFMGQLGNWWSATGSGSNSAKFYGVYDVGDSSNRFQQLEKGYGLSVRCIKD
jgi:uncharacterized protein (TIGR02145 family)